MENLARWRVGMSRRVGRIVGVVAVAVYLAGAGILVRLGVLLDRAGADGQSPLEGLAILLGFGAFTVVGALILAHQPRNAIGWIFTAIGLMIATLSIGNSYASYLILTGREPSTAALIAAWPNNFYWYVLLALTFVFVPLLFPTGRPPSPRWWAVGWLAGLSMSVTATLSALAESIQGQDVGWVRPNPFGINGLRYVEQLPVAGVLFFCLIAAMLGAVASFVVRYRRSYGEERQQLKWFLFAVSLLPFSLLFDFLLEDIGWLLNILFPLVVAALPTAAGVAILRYRLYAIDRIISRTLAYGLLTGVLVAVYAASVLVLGQVLAPVTQGSELAVAGSTLVVAALFGPVRRRVQAGVDRRFNRSRYDAERIVEAFRARLRDEVDLDTLSADLLGAVGATVEPRRVALWLRPTPRDSQR
ncbi:MAG: hypothetical protein ACR2MA_10595 [Egibacteraceae bacterium]